MQGQKQDVSIGRGCESKGIVIHELLHALGFYHEQSRRDRDKYITINWSNIQKNRESNFKKYSPGKATTHNEAYDKQSVMHYGNYAFAINRNVKTITSKSNRNEVLGQRNGFSTIDLKQLNKHYSCKTPVSCVDKNRNCGPWASRGECKKNPRWMQPNCCKSCKNPPCNDYNRWCNYWARIGECSKNPNYMLGWCCKSCKAANCVDKNRYCGPWAAGGECKKNPNYMQPNCCKSCKSYKGDQEMNDKNSANYETTAKFIIAKEDLEKALEKLENDIESPKGADSSNDVKAPNVPASPKELTRDQELSELTERQDKLMDTIKMLDENIESSKDVGIILNSTEA